MFVCVGGFEVHLTERYAKIYYILQTKHSGAEIVCPLRIVFTHNSLPIDCYSLSSLLRYLCVCLFNSTPAVKILLILFGSKFCVFQQIDQA